MKTNREAPISALRALVEAGKRFGEGQVIVDIAPHMDTMTIVRFGDNHRVQQRQPWGEGRVRYGAMAQFFADTANARPHMEAILAALPVLIEAAAELESRIRAERAGYSMDRADEIRAAIEEVLHA